ncbi:MAG TPA: M20/M25/M40 family metallo-hydrolase [Vicinamibacterales bacterium]
MDPLRLLFELIAIDSVNPALVPGGAGERAMADFLANHLRRAGFDVECRDAAPGRPNVVAVADGAGPGPTCMLCGHTDTVGVDGMRAPFDPVLRDGRVYGRGAQDMKGGLAAMIAAAETWLRSGRTGAGRVVVACVADEEHASVGAEALARDWRADAAVVPEPTDLSIGVAHKGFAWVTVTTLGKAAHGSRPQEGRDAVMHMGRVLARLETLDRTLQGQGTHPRLGRPSLHAGRVEGGGELSVYPARCTLEIERRTLPHEPADVAIDEVRAILAELSAADPAFAGDARLLLARPGYEIPTRAALPQALARAAAAEGIEPVFTGTSFWTDAALLADAGIPAVLFGPRGGGLHGADEFVVADDVARCGAVLARWLSDPG